MHDRMTGMSVLCFAVGIVAGTSQASGDPAEALVAAVQANFDAMKIVSCTLSVTAAVSEPGSGDGRIVKVRSFRCWLKVPNTVRRENEDGSVEIRGDGGHWRIDPEGNIVELPVDETDPANYSLVPAYLSSFSEFAKGMRMTGGRIEDGLIALEEPSSGNGGTPRRRCQVHDGSATVRDIWLFDGEGKPYQVVTIEYVSVAGLFFPVRIVEKYLGRLNTTIRTYEYSSVRINEPLPEDLFRP